MPSNKAAEKFSRLSPRQRELAVHIACSFKREEIATRMGISTKTVDSHRQILMARLGVQTDIEVKKLAHDAGAVER